MTMKENGITCLIACRMSLNILSSVATRVIFYVSRVGLFSVTYYTEYQDNGECDIAPIPCAHLFSTDHSKASVVLLLELWIALLRYTHHMYYFVYCIRFV